MLRVFDVESPLTWVQYTAWILLYPLAFFCEGEPFNFVFESVTNTAPIREGTLMLLSITLFDRKERLPEDMLYDYTFSMSWILRIFVLFFYFPSKFSDCSFLHPYSHPSQSSLSSSQFPNSFLHESDADVQEAQVPAQKEESRLEETDFHTKLQTAGENLKHMSTLISSSVE